MPYLEMNNITMRFPGVVALDHVSFQLELGEVHVLLGENGAGKSTLIKILSGINRPSEGNLVIDGKKYDYLTPEESLRNRIAVIYQELSVVDNLSIAENLFVGKIPYTTKCGIKVVDRKKMYKEAEKYMKEIGLKCSPTTLVQDISISEKQQVEIAKALCAQAKIVVMDEPTSSLSIEETERLFTIIRKLKEMNIAIIYISHKLQELKQIGDRVTVLKDGKYVKTLPLKDLETNDLIPLMVGRKVKNEYLNVHVSSEEQKEILFSARNITRADGSCRNISFDVHRGEILGFAGLIGAGRSECMEGIFGAKPLRSGEIFYKGQRLKIKDPYCALKQGIAMVTENRRETGFFPNFPIWKEAAVSTSLKRSFGGGLSGLVQTKTERKISQKINTMLNTKCTGIDQMTVNLSGGNQQKVIISKWLAIDSDVFIFDEPTKGIDVGAKSEIYEIIRKMCDEGKAIIMISSDMPELLSVCDRIIVFREGEISGEMDNASATEEKIMLAAVHVD